MKVTYTRKGDYLLPDLYLEKDENYGRLGSANIFSWILAVLFAFFRQSFIILNIIFH